MTRTTPKTSLWGRIRLPALAGGFLVFLCMVAAFSLPTALLTGVVVLLENVENREAQAFTAGVTLTESEELVATQLNAVLSSSGWLVFLAVSGSLTIVVAGFVAALLAKRFRRLQALVLGCLLLVLSLTGEVLTFALATRIDYSFRLFLSDVWSYATMIPLAMLGGWVGAKFPPLARPKRVKVASA